MKLDLSQYPPYYLDVDREDNQEFNYFVIMAYYLDSLKDDGQLPTYSGFEEYKAFVEGILR